jgi:PST family polysaccharide transporter
MSAAFLLMGAGGFPRAQLARELRFAELARIDVIVAIVATAAMIAGGALGAGAYSFAIFLLVSEGLTAVLAWRAYPNQPKISADPRSLRGLLRTGAHVTGYHVLNQTLGLLDTFAIGRFFGAHVLGLYNRPAQLLALGNQFVVTPLSDVSLATLSRLGGDSAGFRRQVAQTITVATHLVFPLATLSLAIPEETIQLVLGNQWLEAALLLRLLAVTAIVNAVTVLLFGVNVAAGQTHNLFVSVAVALPLTAAAIALGLPYGAVGVATGLAAINMILAWPRWWWMLRGTPVGVADLASALSGPCAANLALGLGLTLGRLCVAEASWSIRLVSAGVGGIVAVGLLGATWPRLRREARELLTHLPGRAGSQR